MFPTISTLSILTKEFKTITKAENFVGLILKVPTLSLIRTFLIFILLSEIRNKDFVSDLLFFKLLSARIFWIKTFLAFSTPPVNINNS